MTMIGTTYYDGDMRPKREPDAEPTLANNAEEAKVDDRHMLHSLRKIDDVAAQVWRMRERVADGEQTIEHLTARIAALEAKRKGTSMIRFFVWCVVGAFALLLGFIAWTWIT